MPYKYRLDLSYLGAPFHGWQSQPDGMGVQDYLERALDTILQSKPRILGASRTDAGVHAEQQVAVFTESRELIPDKTIAGLNALTPHEISVFSLTPASDTFHPILSSKAKCYRYRLWTERVLSPFFAPYSWHVKGVLDVAAMTSAAELLKGQHDFTSFCATDSGAKTRVRTIREILIDVRGPLIDIWIMGEGFLKHMVRNIVGTLVEIGLSRRGWSVVPSIIEARNRSMAGMTAPAHGLTLVRILYEDGISCADLIHGAGQGFCVAV